MIFFLGVGANAKSGREELEHRVFRWSRTTGIVVLRRQADTRTCNKRPTERHGKRRGTGARSISLIYLRGLVRTPSSASITVRLASPQQFKGPVLRQPHSRYRGWQYRQRPCRPIRTRVIPRQIHH